MNLRSVLSIVVMLHVFSVIAMNKKPISLEDYDQVLQSNDCKRIVEATKTLWPKGKVGVHIHWSGSDFQVTGERRQVKHTGGFMATKREFNDGDHRKLLRHWVITQLLHTAIFGTDTKEIAQAFAKIDELSNNYDGIFGDDKRGLTQKALKQAIIIGQFPNESDVKKLIGKLAHFNLPLANIFDAYDKTSINNLIVYVGERTGEMNPWTGKLPFKVKLYKFRRLIGFMGLVAVVCIGSYVTYKKYWAQNEEDEESEEEQDAAQGDQITGGQHETA